VVLVEGLFLVLLVELVVGDLQLAPQRVVGRLKRVGWLLLRTEGAGEPPRVRTHACPVASSSKKKKKKKKKILFE
jgi:hypothetical protein